MKVLRISFTATFTHPSMIETINVCLYSPKTQGAGNKTEPRSAGMKPTHVGEAQFMSCRLMLLSCGYLTHMVWAVENS